MSSVPADDSRQDARRAATARVFFALWPPPEAARKLAAVADSFAQCAGGRPTRQATVHLTLAFLGDVTLERLPDLERAARNVRAETFDLTLDRFGLWQHNRIFWAGCTMPPTALGVLAASLRPHLQDGGFTVADANRPFMPHMTLVRKVARLQTPVPQCGPQRWLCREFVLARSVLSSGGAHYEPIGRWPLE